MAFLKTLYAALQIAQAADPTRLAHDEAYRMAVVRALSAAGDRPAKVESVTGTPRPASAA